jgi:hypothetical protein
LIGMFRYEEAFIGLQYFSPRKIGLKGTPSVSPVQCRAFVDRIPVRDGIASGNR